MKKNHSLIKDFRKRWNRIKAFEDRETRELSVTQKFYLLTSLINMGRALQLDFGEDKRKIKVRARWVALKKAIR